MRHKEAFEGFREVLEGEEVSGLEEKAKYKIVVYYLIQGMWDQAEMGFQEVVKDESADANTIAWSEYCLASMEVQKYKSHQAIERYQKIIDAGEATDEDVYAWSYYEIGRVYFSMLQDREKAHAAFQKVMELYPNSKPAKRRCWLE